MNPKIIISVLTVLSGIIGIYKESQSQTEKSNMGERINWEI